MERDKRHKWIGYLLLLLSLHTAGQDNRIYRIGDTLPDICLRELVNFPSGQARLADFKGRLVILDYWATWCSPCVAAFPKLEALSSRFKDSLQIIGITKEPLLVVNKLFGRMKERGQRPIVSVVNDDYLYRLFPHNQLPHCVWISDQGVVIAITGADQVTEQNIQWALESCRQSG